MGKLASLYAVYAVSAALAVGCGSDSKGGTSTGASNTGGTTTGIFLAGAVTTLAGNGTHGRVDGPGGRNGTAEFFRPEGVAADSHGNVFVADTNNNCVRMIDSSGNVTTLQSSVSFQQPSALAIDGQGVLYVAVADSDQVWKIDSTGVATILAGNGKKGVVDGPGGPTGPAEFYAPAGVAVDSAGNVYVSDDDRVRKIDPLANVTTLAGNGTDGFVDGSGGPDGGAEFSAPRGLAVDGAGNVYVADSNNNSIRKIDPAGKVSTLAGTGMAGSLDGSGGRTGSAEFFTPSGVAVDANGNVFVADTANNLIRWVDPSGNVTTWAGVGVPSFADSPVAQEAAFSNPFGIGLASNGGLVVADEVNNCIRLIGP